jgi:cytochrome b subunit of formate dehydrogenase
MLDTLYENIGGKIKNWAKWIFIIEAIGAIITGFVLLFTDEYLILYGLLTLVCGPIVAWVGSWILYAFGELVEDVHAVRKKYYPIAEEQANREAEEKAKREAKELAQKKAQTFSCPKCSNTVNYGDVSCGSCGQQFDWSKM